MGPRSPAFEDLDGGVFLVDAEFMVPGCAACYVVRGRDRAAVVETGTALSTPSILRALDALGVARADVGYVIITHVHLDHAGGAGSLMRELPNAKLVVHPRGARHMQDPTKLIAGATVVYGEAVLRKTYGTILPVPEARIVEAVDGFAVDLGERPLRCFDAPGHAKHHLVVYDERTRGFFTGDTFGLSYRALTGRHGRFIFPTTTPVQFDPEALHRSIDRIMGDKPARIYLTHFGLLDSGLPTYAAILHRSIDQHTRIARAVGPGPDAEARIKLALVELMSEELDVQGVVQDHPQALTLLDMDLQLNAQGLVVWVGKGPSATA